MENYNADRIETIAYGFQAGKVLLTAIHIGVFTELSKGPTDLERLAQVLEIHPRGARDFFDTLVTLELIERNDGLYSNTKDTEYFLVKNQENYIGGMLEMANIRLYNIWGSLEEALRTGKPQNEGSEGKDIFEAIYGDPIKLEGFLAGMSGISARPAHKIAAQFNWKDYQTFCDIGTAQGMCAVTIADAHPHLRGIGFDLAAVEPVFNKFAENNKLADRLEFKAGDFFKGPFPQADVIVMGHILHNWGLNDKRMLIKKAYDALPPGGTLLVYGHIIDDDRRENLPGLLMSLNMLLETENGFDYTGEQCCQWMKEAGFDQCRVEHLKAAWSMVIGSKAS